MRELDHLPISTVLYQVERGVTTLFVAVAMEVL
jgi:hypothetical protein